MDFLGDGYCDDEANTEACLYDMGDCCDFNSISQSLCIECFCYGDLPPITWCTNEIIIGVHNEWKNNLGDGQCDPELNNVKLSADWSRNKEIGPRLIEQGTNKIFIIPSEARVITKFYWSRVRSEGDQFLYFETRRPIITLLLSLLVEQTRVFP